MHNSIPLTDVTADKAAQHLPSHDPNTHSSPVPDATQHNPAVRLAKGRYQLLRRLLCVPLIGLFLLAPWLTLNDAPLLWMDLSKRALHVVGLTLWPDDLLALTWLGFASAFGLFTVATLGGRLWCGFACPQTVWSMMFIWVEERVQGSRQQRLKAMNAPWSQKPWLKIAIKHTGWLAIAFVTGFTFVAFFETGQGLAQQLISGQASVSVWFWLVFFSGLTYLNGGWLREQVCLHMCPYARFQSVMLDQKSFKVTYDVARGEPRLNKQHKQTVLEPTTLEPKTLKPTEPAQIQTQGDCVDCSLCVQVCPVGIDIRQGMQYACIDCAACIDACDAVMEKIKKPTGLIRFDMAAGESFNGTTVGKLVGLIKNRGKLWGYGLLTLLCVAAFATQLWLRENLDAHMTRDRGQLFFYNGNGQLANRYHLKLHNKTREPMQLTLAVQAERPAKLVLHPSSRITLPAGDHRTLAVEVACEYPCASPSRNRIWLSITNHQTQENWSLDQVFYAE